MAKNDIQRKLDEVKRYLQEDLLHVIGQKAVTDMQKNFETQSYFGKKWKEVKRREKDSTWYGFDRHGKQEPPANHPKFRKRKNPDKPYKRRKESPITGYSKVATETPILSSQDSNLERSLKYKIIGPTTIRVYSDVPYADVHNEGKEISVFGRKRTKVPKRQFLGLPPNQKKKIEKIILADIAKILK